MYRLKINGKKIAESSLYATPEDIKRFYDNIVKAYHYTTCRIEPFKDGPTYLRYHEDRLGVKLEGELRLYEDNTCIAHSSLTQTVHQEDIQQIQTRDTVIALTKAFSVELPSNVDNISLNALKDNLLAGLKAKTGIKLK